MAYPDNCRKALVALFLSLVALCALAQDVLQLGSMTYARAEAPYLRMPVTRTQTFFRKVGGVAFDAVAVGVDGLVVTDLRYDRTAQDGARLLVTLQRGPQSYTVRGSLFDWELIPIARFALDENGSAMTLFGQLNDKDQEKRILEAGQRVINYHPALDNTLLGQRLFQADILIIRPDAAHVFRDKRGPLLGAGETSHDPERNLSAFYSVQKWQVEQEKKGLRYQSYVVGDLGQRVAFNVNGGKLEFSGRPYWAAWRSPILTQEGSARADEVENTLIPQYNELVDSYKSEMQLARLRAKSMSETEVQSTIAALKQREAQLSTLKKRIEAERAVLDAVEQLPDFSASLSAKIASVGGINPLVYAAVTNTMHYRALFKHYQKRNSGGLTSFVRSLDGLPLEPRVITPTVQHGR